MGGDNGPRVAIHGARAGAAASARTRSFIFHGREAELTPLLDEFPDLKPVAAIVHCDNVIAMDEKPIQALRKGRGNSSMWMAIQSVKDGEADVAISGGNTGALMAMATFCLRPIEGISRPAIAAIWPTLRDRHHRARRRRHRRRRRQAAGRFLDPGRGAGPRAVRPGGARPSACSMSAPRR